MQFSFPETRLLIFNNLLFFKLFSRFVGFQSFTSRFWKWCSNNVNGNNLCLAFRMSEFTLNSPFPNFRGRLVDESKLEQGLYYLSMLQGSEGTTYCNWRNQPSQPTRQVQLAANHLRRRNWNVFRGPQIQDAWPAKPKLSFRE